MQVIHKLKQAEDLDVLQESEFYSNLGKRTIKKYQRTHSIDINRLERRRSNLTKCPRACRRCDSR
jgi:hypothetical protein